MLLYCLKCRKNTESKNPKVVSTKKRRKGAVCDSKKSKFIKKEEVSGLLSTLGMKTPLNKIFFNWSFFYFRGINKLIKRYRK